MKKIALLSTLGLTIGLLSSSLVYANPRSPYAPTSVSVGYGRFGIDTLASHPNNLQVIQLGAQWDWHKHWLPLGQWFLGGFWSLQASYLHAEKKKPTQNQNMLALSGAPIFYWKRAPYASTTIAPYVEAGVGIAVVSHKSIGTSEISTLYQFESRVGVGMQFGSKQQYDLAVAYGHISNASIKTPNSGIDILPLITFRYHFT